MPTKGWGAAAGGVSGVGMRRGRVGGNERLGRRWQAAGRFPASSPWRRPASSAAAVTVLHTAHLRAAPWPGCPAPPSRSAPRRARAPGPPPAPPPRRRRGRTAGCGRPGSRGPGRSSGRGGRQAVGRSARFRGGCGWVKRSCAAGRWRRRGCGLAGSTGAAAGPGCSPAATPQAAPPGGAHLQQLLAQHALHGVVLRVQVLLRGEAAQAGAAVCGASGASHTRRHQRGCGLRSPTCIFKTLLHACAHPSRPAPCAPPHPLHTLPRPTCTKSVTTAVSGGSSSPSAPTSRASAPA